MSKLRYPPGGIAWHEDDGLWRRDTGPCAICDDGTVYFSQNSTPAVYRLIGPSIIKEYGEIQYTNTNGQPHRTDGPAIIYANGSKEYWINNSRYLPEEFFLKYGVV